MLDLKLTDARGAQVCAEIVDRLSTDPPNLIWVIPAKGRHRNTREPCAVACFQVDGVVVQTVRGFGKETSGISTTESFPWNDIGGRDVS